MASRIKIMASLDIAEKRLPQDGRIALRLAGRQVDVRVSTLPTAHGERIVLRLLDKAAASAASTAWAWRRHRQRLRRAARQPHGIVLVTGPTGSGKTTTLYAAAAHGRQAATSSPSKTRSNTTCPASARSRSTQDRPDLRRALRAILRQDPDVIMIGEIRDLETAQIAVQASLTGHLVLATLHTNDAASAVTRLVDMGVEPFLLASTLRGVLAQRLVRRCARPAAPSRHRRRPRTARRRTPGPAVAPRLPRMRPHRLRRPHRHLRTDRHRRRLPAPDPHRRRRSRLRAHARPRRPACATTACACSPRRTSAEELLRVTRE
jgi:general secretion pathway protein E